MPLESVVTSEGGQVVDGRDVDQTGGETMAVGKRDRPWNGEPSRDALVGRGAGTDDEKAELDARVDPHGNGDRSLPRRDEAEDPGDVARLQASVRAYGEYRRTHDAAGDRDVAGGEACGVD